MKLLLLRKRRIRQEQFAMRARSLAAGRLAPRITPPTLETGCDGSHGRGSRRLARGRMERAGCVTAIVALSRRIGARQRDGFRMALRHCAGCGLLRRADCDFARRFPRNALRPADVMDKMNVNRRAAGVVAPTLGGFRRFDVLAALLHHIDEQLFDAPAFVRLGSQPLREFNVVFGDGVLVETALPQSVADADGLPAAISLRLCGCGGRRAARPGFSVTKRFALAALRQQSASCSVSQACWEICARAEPRFASELIFFLFLVMAMEGGVANMRSHCARVGSGVRCKRVLVCGERTKAGAYGTGRRSYASTCTVTPDPPVIEVTLARTKLARTPVTVRASPAVAVEESIDAYSASASTMAVCSDTLTAEGAVP